MTFDQALVAKAKETKSVEELLTLAKENGIELTAEEAEQYYTELHPAVGELADEELENVAGGGCGGKKEKIDESYYGVGDEVTFDIGDGTIKEGTIVWKGVVNSYWADGCSVMYRIQVGKSVIYGEFYNVFLSQIKTRTWRYGEVREI